MTKNKDTVTFSQEMQLDVRKKRTAFPVDMVDWKRLRKMITNHTPSFVIWANISSAGFSAALSIFLTWLTVVGEQTYPYKTHLLVAVFTTLTIGTLSAVFARTQKKNETFSKDQILEEMNTMQISNEESLEDDEENELKILKAEYGLPGNFVNVTDKLNDLIEDNKLEAQATNALVPSDPTPGKKKVLEIDYEFGGDSLHKKFVENEIVSLP